MVPDKEIYYNLIFFQTLSGQDAKTVNFLAWFY